ncbi:LOW QUALITY PROTEIN: hypothetical protein U9M48_027554 [Paspalum notatum var. saurae]|uniref:Retrovirus-related Pol polyprotein from transposon TNT 1-94-like beta-barrel domain-containing protein n=1 Tax=Paspalum notatum var. saurae TaxID=547442 RepID=A0AAQ3TT58_PASNO
MEKPEVQAVTHKVRYLRGSLHYGFVYGKGKNDAKLWDTLTVIVKLLEQLKTTTEIVKYALEPNPIKLPGPENYVSWARHARLILSSHLYEGLLVSSEGDTKELNAQDKQINARVLVWLLSSMEPIVREQVKILAIVVDVWLSLESQFARKSNKMQATRIMHEITHLKQDSRSVTEYAEFDLRRQLIFSKAEWPSLDDIISSITEEETRLRHPAVDAHGGPDACAALSMKSKEEIKCDHCGAKGHKIERCFKLHGFPQDWKKGKTQPGRNRGGNWNKANHTASERELPVVDAQALEKYNSKLKLSEDPSSTHGSFTAASFQATSQGIKNAQVYTPRSWIIDSGATNHMTGASNFFTHYTPCSGKDKVRVADGSLALIIGRGSIKCTKTLSISPVLYVPNFPINRLSVSSITKSLNCRGWFVPSRCAFLELGIGRILGTGTMHNGLYYLDEGSD